MDLQGVINRSDVLNGAELVLLPGNYSMSAMRGSGSVVDLSLFGKISRSVRSLATRTIRSSTAKASADSSHSITASPRA